MLYRPTGHIEEAAYVCGHSFGDDTGPNSVNYELATLMTKFASGRSMIADRTLVDALPGLEQDMALVVEGPTTNIRAQGVGTWGTLLALKDYIIKKDKADPCETVIGPVITVAQAYHMNRVLRQTSLLEMEPIAPEGMPIRFPEQSGQFWARGRLRWLIFDAIGSNTVLRIRGQY